ncbi:TerD family protein [Nocardia sp. CDC159]|uniref:TerD family protein n=1 Tax=Nocardia pulmonis TaxID=2951408 RepID=A0A9X2E1C1_9NOCA|nr:MULTISPECIES: TerD family protein [Nocardia]MCM6772364.1 TerD family protein [Nocardia pulmonis]MCM6784978.1 TerD family protein [Nocardia sp. CDC159]
MAAQLTRGQVDRLTVDDIVVAVRHSEPVDVAALLLDAAGRVRGEGDLIFYNKPTGPGLRLMPGDEPALALELRRVPADVDHVRVVVTLDDRQAHFGDYPPTELRIVDPAGNMLYQYLIEGLGPESTVIAFDLDRVGADWQVRVLGHGYAAGFEALVKAHGVPIGGVPGEQWVYRGPAVLNPGQEISLQEIRKGELTMVKLGLQWDPVKVHSARGLRDVEIDLDASALLFVGHDLVDFAFYYQLSSRNGAVRHSGDNVTGEGKGDDEIITVDLSRLPAQVSSLVFVVTSYAGHTFERLRNAFWRLIDGTTNAELARGNLRAGGQHTGMIVAKVYRDDATWRLAAIGEPIQAGHPVEAVAPVTRFL